MDPRRASARIIAGKASAGLVVEGDLTLAAGELAGLPQGLEVRGCLTLFSCKGLGSLPSGLRVAGSLSVLGQPELESLPPGLEVAGSLRLVSCPGLRRLGKGLAVGGDLVLSDCPALESLPEGLSVGGSMSVERCPGLERLPTDLEVLGDLDLRGCGRLSELPEGLYVEGGLSLEGTRVAGLPADCHVGACLVGRVAVPSRIYFEAHKMSFDEVLAVDNVEVRRVALERMGWEAFLSRSGGRARLVDSDADPRVGALYRIEVPGDEPISLLKVRCATLPKSYVLRVPPDSKTAREANAWTWDLEAGKYWPVDEA